MPEQMKYTIKSAGEISLSKKTAAAFPVAVWNEETNTAVALFTTQSEASEYRNYRAITPDQRLVDAALNVVRADYYQDVRDTVESIKEELEGRIADQECGESLREWLLEHIHETIDGSSRVIYTHFAMLGVFASDNDGAYFEEFGDDGAVSDGSINWSAICFAAFERDVTEQLEAIGVDVNNPVPKCDKCGADDQDERHKVGDNKAGWEWFCESCHDELTAETEEPETEEPETEEPETDATEPAA